MQMQKVMPTRNLDSLPTGVQGRYRIHVYVGKKQYDACGNVAVLHDSLGDTAQLVSDWVTIKQFDDIEEGTK